MATIFQTIFDRIMAAFAWVTLGLGVLATALVLVVIAAAILEALLKRLALTKDVIMWFWFKHRVLNRMRGRADVLSREDLVKIIALHGFRASRALLEKDYDEAHRWMNALTAVVPPRGPTS